MAGTHVLDANLEIIPEQLRADGGRHPAPHGISARRGPLFSLARMASDFVLGLLERLQLCHAPRILSAECLVHQATLPGAIRQE
jgi:hypothetical protein